MKFKGVLILKQDIERRLSRPFTSVQQAFLHALGLSEAIFLQRQTVPPGSLSPPGSTMIAAQAAGRLKAALHKYLNPRVLLLDEVGYLPIDKAGADLLFQIVSHRYERGSIILTSNRAYKKWPEISNNDATLTSALPDRLLHHAETILIEGSSYRMKERTDNA